MSNLILNLQKGLINTKIYNDIKNKEIINLIEEYNNNPNDFIDYKIILMKNVLKIIKYF